MGAFVLQVSEIESKGRIERTFVINSAWIREAVVDTEYEAPAEFEAPLTVVARSIGDDILVEGEFSAELLVPCARCGDPVSLALAGDFTQLLTSRGSTPLPEELELTPEDLERDTFSGPEIALDDFVREFIFLEVPMSPRCKAACADPEVRRILRLGPDGEPQPLEKPGALAGLKDLAEKLKRGES